MRLPVTFLMMFVALGVCAQPADTVFVNGEIYTVNDVQPWIQALAVKDRRIVFAGNARDAQNYIGTETKVVDLQGNMVMPGIHDAHIHLMYGGMDALGCSILSGPIEGAGIEALKECAADLEDGEWLVARPFFVEQFPDNKPHRKYLDAAFPDRPVYLVEMTGHNGLANSRALEIAGIDDSSVAPEGGAFTRDENGDLTGELVESATALIRNVIPPPTAEDRLAALKEAIRICNRYGITSVQEASASEDYLIALRELEDSNGLSLNVKAHIVWGQERHSKETMAEIRNFIESRASFQTEHIDPNGIKMWLDGTPTGPYFTAADLDPETGEPEWDLLLIPPKLLNEYVTEFDAMGMKVKIHASGAGSARVVLDAYEAAHNANPDSSIRHDLGHTNLITMPDMNRLRELNVVAELSPSLWYSHGKHLGDPPQRAWQFRTLSNKGALLTVGSDWSVSKTPNPFPPLQGMLLFDDESMDLISSLRAITLNGALAIGREEDLGTLQPGKLANFVVLDRNLFAVQPEEIGGTQVLMTVFEGDVVYEK